MLDDHDRITLVAKLLERSDELAVVPLMKSDRRLVADVQHIDELGTYLGRQSDALALSSRKRRSRTVERKIIQTYIEKELHPVLELLENIAGDSTLPLVKDLIQREKPVLQLGDFHSGNL